MRIAAIRMADRAESVQNENLKVWEEIKTGDFFEFQRRAR
jgi:hypothetical protein